MRFPGGAQVASCLTLVQPGSGRARVGKCWGNHQQNTRRPQRLETSFRLDCPAGGFSKGSSVVREAPVRLSHPSVGSHLASQDCRGHSHVSNRVPLIDWIVTLVRMQTTRNIEIDACGRKGTCAPLHKTAARPWAASTGLNAGRGIGEVPPLSDRIGSGGLNGWSCPPGRRRRGNGLGYKNQADVAGPSVIPAEPRAGDDRAPAVDDGQRGRDHGEGRDQHPHQSGRPFKHPPKPATPTGAIAGSTARFRRVPRT